MVSCPLIDIQVLLTFAKKINEAESLAKLLYTARSHQSNNNSQDESLPLFVTLFFAYFDFCQTRESGQNQARQAKRRHQRMN